MTHQVLSDHEVRRAGLEALSERLGPAGLIRFLRMFDPGRGDYTAERHQWLDKLTLDDLVRSIEKDRGTKKP